MGLCMNKVSLPNQCHVVLIQSNAPDEVMFAKSAELTVSVP